MDRARSAALRAAVVVQQQSSAVMQAVVDAYVNGPVALASSKTPGSRVSALRARYARVIHACGTHKALATQAHCIDACRVLLDKAGIKAFSADVTKGVFSVELSGQASPEQQERHTYVFAAGYGSGLGLFCLNLGELAAAPDTERVVAFDWLGTGCSERPPFTAKSVAEGEEFFVRSLEEWRKEKGLESFTLVGHSLGGYLSSAYALAHPERVKHLILLSPAGIPKPPDSAHTMRRERRGLAMSLLQRAWEGNVTPQQLIRALGPRARNWAGDVLTRRFAHVLAREPRLHRDALVDYFWSITTAPASGELALNVLLSFGAHARQAMGPRLVGGQVAADDAATHPAPARTSPDAADAKDASQIVAERAGPGLPASVPVTFLYGSHDWMPWRAGEAVCQQLRQLQPTRAPRPGVPASEGALTLVVPNSGHHLYLEQPHLVNAAILQRVRACSASSNAATQLR